MEDCCGDEKTPAQKFLICWARLLRLLGRSFENLGLVFFGREEKGRRKNVLHLLYYVGYGAVSIHESENVVGQLECHRQSCIVGLRTHVWGHDHVGEL